MQFACLERMSLFTCLDDTNMVIYFQSRDSYTAEILSCSQCDQKKIAKCLQKLPKNDFTRKMIDFDTFTKIA